MELTKDEAIRLHKELWDWLSKNPKAQKYDWPEWESNGGHINKAQCNCFCCEFAYILSDVNNNDICENCPLRWPYNCCQQADKNGNTFGLFEDWQNAKSDKRTRLAEQIRDLPVREDDV